MNVKYFLILIIFLQNVFPINTIFNNALKKLKQKSKEAFKKKFGKDKTHHFLGYDLSEFPGTNENYRQINREKWDDYYTCLTTENSNIGQDFSKTPEALQAFVSASINPEELTALDSVEWYWSGILSESKFKPVDYTENILLTPSDRSLQIYKLQPEQSGQYLCRIGKAEASPYFLTVTETPDDKLLEVHSVEAPNGPYPQKPAIINNYNLVIDTMWSPWTSCSKCNQIGRRHRLGSCVVKYQQHDSYKNIGNDTESEVITIAKKHYELLRIFKFGVPCNSHILPHSLKKLHHVQNRKNELMSGFCKISCPENKIFEVRDKNGKVIETANNSAGIYSILQGIPSIQPTVERMLQYAEKDKETILACPGNLNSDVPVQWQIGSKKLIPELLVSESKGRMYISITDKIHIKKTKLTDTNIYSCWQYSDLAGTVRLIVEKKISLDFNHHIMLIGVVLIFSVIFYIFIKAFFQKKKALTET